MRRSRPRPTVRPLRPTVRRRRRPVWPALAGVLTVIVVLLVGIWLGGHPNNLPAPLRGRPFVRREGATEQALNILTTRYYRPLKRSSLIDTGLSSMVASLDDPYSHYLDPEAYRKRNEQTTPQVSGIGITSTPEPKGLRVVNVVDQSPAAEAGLKPGDLIIKVGSTSLADRSDDSGSDLIRGPAGTRLQLTFLRDDKRHTVSMERANIVVPVASWRMLTDHHVRIGYLRLTTFSEDSGDKLRTEVRAALHAHAEALLLDLRGNGGGLINQAVNVASTFIAHGEILSAVERGQPRRVYMARDDALAPKIPLAVLVDHGTASSAEIVTAALQDHHRAKVVGTRTHGKGVFQLTHPLNNGGALDITIGEFFTPDGRNLGGGGASQGAGITPNVDAPDDKALEVGERTVLDEVRSAGRGDG